MVWENHGKVWFSWLDQGGGEGNLSLKGLGENFRWGFQDFKNQIFEKKLIFEKKSKLRKKSNFRKKV